MAKLHYFVALPRRFNAQLYFLLWAAVFGFLFQIIIRIYTRFGFGAACLRLTTHPFQFFTQQIAVFLERSLVSALAFGLFLQIIAVVAIVREYFAFIYF